MVPVSPAGREHAPPSRLPPSPGGWALPAVTSLCSFQPAAGCAQQTHPPSPVAADAGGRPPGSPRDGGTGCFPSGLHAPEEGNLRSASGTAHKPAPHASGEGRGPHREGQSSTPVSRGQASAAASPAVDTDAASRSALRGPHARGCRGSRPAVCWGDGGATSRVSPRTRGGQGRTGEGVSSLRAPSQPLIPGGEGEAFGEAKKPHGPPQTSVAMTGRSVGGSHSALWPPGSSISDHSLRSSGR